MHGIVLRLTRESTFSPSPRLPLQDKCPFSDVLSGVPCVETTSISGIKMAHFKSLSDLR